MLLKKINCFFKRPPLFTLSFIRQPLSSKCIFAPKFRAALFPSKWRKHFTAKNYGLKQSAWRISAFATPKLSGLVQPVCPYYATSVSRDHLVALERFIRIAIASWNYEARDFQTHLNISPFWLRHLLFWVNYYSPLISYRFLWFHHEYSSLFRIDPTVNLVAIGF